MKAQQRLFKTLVNSLGFACLGVSNSFALTVSIHNTNAPNEGLNDPTPRIAVIGNPGITLGQQRMNTLNAAADFWETQLDVNVEIVINAQVKPMTCSENQASLASAGLISFEPNAIGIAEMDQSLEPSGLTAQLNRGRIKIDLMFNSNLDNSECLEPINWSYVLGQPVPSGSIGFYNVIVQQIGHRLRFLTIDHTVVTAAPAVELPGWIAYIDPVTGTLTSNPKPGQLLSEEPEHNNWLELTHIETSPLVSALPGEIVLPIPDDTSLSGFTVAMSLNGQVSATFDERFNRLSSNSWQAFIDPVTGELVPQPVVDNDTTLEPVLTPDVLNPSNMKLITLSNGGLSIKLDGRFNRTLSASLASGSVQFNYLIDTQLDNPNQADYQE